jgi:hypothetical protein
MMGIILNRIAELEDERRWIPVSERLPEDRVPVLIITYSNHECIHIGYHTTKPLQWSLTEGLYYHDVNYSMVTYWKPLPPPPEVK